MVVDEVEVEVEVVVVVEAAVAAAVDAGLLGEDICLFVLKCRPTPSPFLSSSQSNLPFILPRLIHFSGSKASRLMKIVVLTVGLNLNLCWWINFQWNNLIAFYQVVAKQFSLFCHVFLRLGIERIYPPLFTTVSF